MCTHALYHIHIMHPCLAHVWGICFVWDVHIRELPLVYFKRNATNRNNLYWHVFDLSFLAHWLRLEDGIIISIIILCVFSFYGIGDRHADLVRWGSCLPCADSWKEQQEMMFLSVSLDAFCGPLFVAASRLSACCVYIIRYVYMYVYTYIYIYIHIHMYVCMYTYIYIYIHTYYYQ